MKKVSLYIGSNNVTNKMEKEKVITILNKYYERMSITDMTGIWKNKREKSIRVDIIVENIDHALLEKACKEINKELSQKRITAEIIEVSCLFIY